MNTAEMRVNGENPAECWKFIFPKNELFCFVSTALRANAVVLSGEKVRKQKEVKHNQIVLSKKFTS